MLKIIEPIVHVFPYVIGANWQFFPFKFCIGIGSCLTKILLFQFFFPISITHFSFKINYFFVVSSFKTSHSNYSFSAHSKSPGESKLFDYEITQPRSRRQLLASDLSAETSRAGADAGRTSEQSHNKGHRTSLPPSINILPGTVTVKPEYKRAIAKDTFWIA